MVTVAGYRLIGILCGAAALLAAGCEGTLIPNADPALRKRATEFTADAAKRQYETDAPKALATDFRADYALSYRQVEIANISGEDRSNVEVWINGKYVVFCDKFEQKSAKTLPFNLFYDAQGHRFDTEGGKNAIESLEVYRDGTMYSVNDHVADIR